MKVKLSARVRPNCEAAPWVIEEIEEYEAHIERLQQQQNVLKEQLTTWKGLAREHQLVAGRYQYLFEEAMKAVNKIDDVFEYMYASMHPVEIRKTVYAALSAFTAAASKLVRGPAEKQD